MRLFTLQALTWATVTGAVSSALWLASIEPGPPASPELRGPATHTGAAFRLPTEPTAAGGARRTERRPSQPAHAEPARR